MEEKEERERERVNVVTLYLRLEFLHSSRSVCTKYLRLIWIRHVSPTASKANFSARPIGAGIMGVLVKTSPRITWLKVLHARAHLPRKTEKNERKVGEKGKTRPLSRYVSIICIQCTNRDSIWIRSFPWLKRTASKKEKKKKNKFNIFLVDSFSREVMLRWPSSLFLLPLFFFLIWLSMKRDKFKSLCALNRDNGPLEFIRSQNSDSRIFIRKKRERKQNIFVVETRPNFRVWRKSCHWNRFSIENNVEFKNIQ